MDVPDRSVRLDVLSAIAPPAPADKASSAPLSADGPTFASALQRAPETQAETRPATNRTDAPLKSKSSDVDGAPPTSTSGTPLDPTEADASRNNPAPVAPSSSPHAGALTDDPADEDAGEVAVPELIAGLMAATAPMMLAGPAPVELVAAWELSPPVSFVNALQSPLDTAELAAVPAAAPLPELPPIPAGLQAALGATSASAPGVAASLASLPSAELPAAIDATTNVTADLARVNVALPDSQPASAVNAAVATPQWTSVKVSPVLPTNSAPLTPKISPSTGMAATPPATSSSTSRTESAETTVTDRPATSLPAAPQISATDAGLTTPLTAPTSESSAESRSKQVDPSAFRRNPSLVSRDPADVSSLVGLGESASLRGAAFPAEAGPVAGLPENGPRFPAIVDQLQPALHQAVTQDRRLTIMLRPPELGPVQIDVLRHDGRVSARLQTETASAHQLLTEHLPQLREVLTQLGVAADQVQVVRSETPLPDSTSGDARADGKTDAQNAGQRQESRQQAPPEPQLADEPEREDSNWQNIRTRTALNLRI